MFCSLYLFAQLKSSNSSWSVLLLWRNRNFGPPLSEAQLPLAAVQLFQEDHQLLILDLETGSHADVTCWCVFQYYLKGKVSTRWKKESTTKNKSLVQISSIPSCLLSLEVIAVGSSERHHWSPSQLCSLKTFTIQTCDMRREVGSSWTWLSILGLFLGLRGSLEVFLLSSTEAHTGSKMYWCSWLCIHLVITSCTVTNKTKGRATMVCNAFAIIQ